MIYLFQIRSPNCAIEKGNGQAILPEKSERISFKANDSLPFKILLEQNRTS
jgi:hypothetical protein